MWYAQETATRLQKIVIVFYLRAYKNLLPSPVPYSEPVYSVNIFKFSFSKIEFNYIQLCLNYPVEYLDEALGYKPEGHRFDT
jgi:hypothetical protein